jgi:hypothetical protein
MQVDARCGYSAPFKRANLHSDGPGFAHPGHELLLEALHGLSKRCL